MGDAGTGRSGGGMSGARLPKRQAVEKPPSDFLCRPRYRFEIPEAPMDLKMKVVRLDLSAYRQHQVTSLDYSYKRPLITDELFGIRINHADTSLYREFAPGEGLSSADLALLSDNAANRVETPRADAAKSEIPGPPSAGTSSKPVPSGTPAKPKETRRTGPENPAKVAPPRRENVDRATGKKKRVSGPAAVEKSFEVVSSAPVHPDPGRRKLKPSHILPVLPNLGAWGSKYLMVQFDRDPMVGASNYTDEEGKEEEEAKTESLAAEAALSAVTEGRKAEAGKGHILTYYVPTPETVRQRRKKRARDDGDQQEGEEQEDKEQYKKLREYTFTVQNRADDRSVSSSFVLSRRDGAFFFTPVDTKMTLHRRSQQSGRGAGESGQTESRLVLTRREESVDEREKLERGLEGRIDSREGDGGSGDGNDSKTTGKSTGEEGDGDENDEDDVDADRAALRRAAAAELENDSD